MTRLTHEAGTTAFGYDREGRLRWENRSPAGFGNAFTVYDYDKKKNLIGLTYPGGRKPPFTVDLGKQVVSDGC